MRKTATSKTTPSTRPITSAWLETSIAQARTSLSRIMANSPCRSGASGVVRDVGTSWPSTRVPTVPIEAARTPAACSAASASRTVVVLPWVPVTPIIRSALAGSSYSQAARRPSRSRGRSTITTVASEPALAAPTESVSTATAPADIAWPTNPIPCARVPGSAA